MKKGQRVFVKELNKYGYVVSMKGNKAEFVQLDNGDIVEVVNLTVKIIGLLKSLWLLIKKLF